MGRILVLSLKDLKLLWRDRFGMFWVFGFPLLFGLFFGFVTGGGDGAGKIGLAIIDEDNSESSRALGQKLVDHKSVKVENAASLHEPVLDLAAAARRVRLDKLPAYLRIKHGYGDSLLNFSNNAEYLEVGMDPGRKAESGFLQGILLETTFGILGQQFSDPDFVKKQTQLAAAQLDKAPDLGPIQKTVLRQFFTSLNDMVAKMDGKGMPQGGPFAQKGITMVSVIADEAQPRNSFEITFPSAMLWAVLGCMIGFAISIVTERRQGTLLRLQIAPLSLTEILGGKALACFLASTITALAVLGIGIAFFKVRPANIVYVLLAQLCTSVCFVGVMMFLATLGKTESAVSGSASAAMLVMAMFGGGMIPLMFMPQWMTPISNLSPVKWGILALEGGIWRGFGLQEMLLPCSILLAIGGVGFAIGIRLLKRQQS